MAVGGNSGSDKLRKFRESITELSEYDYLWIKNMVRYWKKTDFICPSCGQYLIAFPSDVAFPEGIQRFLAQNKSIVLCDSCDTIYKI